MSTYKITKAPAELLNRVRNESTSYPFTLLKVGEMFEMPVSKLNSVRSLAYARQLSGKLSKTLKFKFLKNGTDTGYCIRIK